MRSTLAFLVLVIFCAGSNAQSTSQRLRGDVVSIEGAVLTIKTRAGEMRSVRLADNYSIGVVSKIDAERIAPGAFVGIASLPQADGTQRALEVLVFPEAARGSNEGHYPWDLQAGSMMTNATVATVVSVDAGRRVVVKYKDGEKTIVVPKDVPIVTFEPGDRAMLKPGAHVFVVATVSADGSLQASRATVGKDGLVPPM